MLPLHGFISIPWTRSSTDGLTGTVDSYRVHHRINNKKRLHLSESTQKVGRLKTTPRGGASALSSERARNECAFLLLLPCTNSRWIQVRGKLCVNFLRTRKDRFPQNPCEF